MGELFTGPIAVSLAGEILREQDRVIALTGYGTPKHGEIESIRQSDRDTLVRMVEDDSEFVGIYWPHQLVQESHMLPSIAAERERQRKLREALA